MTVQIPAYIRHTADCNCTQCLGIDVAVTLDPDGYFRAIDNNRYDVDCDQDGFFATGPTGYGRTPLDAIVDLLDNMAEG